MSISSPFSDRVHLNEKWTQNSSLIFSAIVAVPGLELVETDYWFKGTKGCGFSFKGLDESSLSSLLCINCQDRPRVLPPWINPKIVELYTFLDV